jgi:hypothetical protein
MNLEMPARDGRDRLSVSRRAAELQQTCARRFARHAHQQQQYEAKDEGRCLLVIETSQVADSI